MNIKYIFIVLGEPYSIFSELIGKYIYKNKKFKKKIILIGNKKLIERQLRSLKYNYILNKIEDLSESKKNQLNIINIDFKFKKKFDKISNKSNKYIEESFNKFFEISKTGKNNFALINGPISKKTFLKKKFLGITEYLSKKTNSNNEVMLIYNNKLSVSPITTHMPIKNVYKNISKQKIINNVEKINNFYKKILKIDPKIAILGLNPHCESIEKYSEEEKIIIPATNFLKRRGVSIKGPFSADTFFIKKNLDKFNIVIGMYHDQVLTPIKTLFNFNAINITLGLPFIRLSPDHGPNYKMSGKNISDPSSFFYAIKFIEKL